MCVYGVPCSPNSDSEYSDWVYACEIVDCRRALNAAEAAASLLLLPPVVAPCRILLLIGVGLVVEKRCKE